MSLPPEIVSSASFFSKRASDLISGGSIPRPVFGGPSMTTESNPANSVSGTNNNFVMRLPLDYVQTPAGDTTGGRTGGGSAAANARKRRTKRMKRNRRTKSRKNSRGR